MYLPSRAEKLKKINSNIIGQGTKQNLTRNFVLTAFAQLNDY